MRRTQSLTNSCDHATQAARCAGPLVRMLLACGAHHYLEFKALQARWVLWLLLS